MLSFIMDKALSHTLLVLKHTTETEKKQRNISNKHYGLKCLNWRETDQLAIYKHDQGVEMGSTEKQLRL